MKKLICLIMAILLVLPFSVSVAAEEVKIEGDWSKYLGKVEVAKTEENGETVFAFKNITSSYATAGIDIMPLLKEIIKGKDSVTLNFSMDIKALAEEDFTLGMLLRTEDVHPKVQKKVDFKQIYEGNVVSVIGDKNYLIRIASGLEVSEEWETVEGEITITPDEVLSGMWKRLMLCFDGIAMFEVIDTLYIKNPVIEIVDYEEGEGKPTIDIETLNVEKPTIALEDNEMPALPEGNHLADNAWYKGTLGNVIPGESDGKIYSFSNISSSFASPVINIYPTIKEMLGDKESIKVWVVFDVRALLVENDRGFGVKIRPNISKDYTEDEALFRSKYTGSAINHTVYGVMISPYSDGKLTNKWQRIELPLTFTQGDINDELWTEWNLCFDGMNDYYQIKELQIKDTAIYYDNEYTSINSSEAAKDPETETGTESENNTVQKPTASTNTPVIYRPYGYDKYTATFADVVEQTLPEGIVDIVINESGEGNPQTDNNNESDVTTIIVIVVAGVVVVGAAVVTTLVVLKEKKLKKEEK